MTNLKKQLGFKEALSITIGVVIGEGIFFKASSVFKIEDAFFISLFILQNIPFFLVRQVIRQ